jgi:hypothetical protein
MSEIQILVIGRQEEILNTVVRLVNSHDNWKGYGASENQKAIQLFSKQHFDLVLIGGGVDNESEILLREEFTLLNPTIKIIQHWGGGSGLLENEIRFALDNINEGNFDI